MKIVDLTHLLSEKVIVRPGQTQFSRKKRQGYVEGSLIEEISFSGGVGTQMSAMSHLFQGGKSIDEIPLSQCMAEAITIHLAERILEEKDFEVSVLDIEKFEEANGKIAEGRVVLVHTGWDRYWQQKNFCLVDKKRICHFPGISKEAAKLLIERKVKGVGIDTMGVDAGFRKNLRVQKVFLQEGIFLVSQLAHLSELPVLGFYVLLIPMKIENAPEAPIRAIALIEA